MEDGIMAGIKHPVTAGIGPHPPADTGAQEGGLLMTVLIFLHSELFGTLSNFGKTIDDLKRLAIAISPPVNYAHTELFSEWVGLSNCALK